MLRRVGLIAVALGVVACSDDGAKVDGPAQEEIDNQPPYGPGVTIGETYDYVMLVHCGVRWARIDGVWWEAAEGAADGPSDPTANWDAGSVVLLDAATAEYTGSDFTAQFVRTGITEPGRPEPCL